jgi:hypothetical protein
MVLKKLKVKRVTECESTKVHDLTVKDAQHYIDNHGIIHHNTGPEYAASIQLFLNKAQLKDSQKNKTGIVVTAKPAKNRFARPNPIKFHLHYTEGMNRYIGLERYIDWENVGVSRGRVEKDGTKVPDPSAKKWICNHLDKTVDNKNFFTSTVFNQEVLNAIEEYYIKDLFRYQDESEFDVEEVINEEEDNNENEEDE